MSFDDDATGCAAFFDDAESTVDAVLFGAMGEWLDVAAAAHIATFDGDGDGLFDVAAAPHSAAFDPAGGGVRGGSGAAAAGAGPGVAATN
ncbi:hypothetical protein AURDEDRAFT_116313 [Auricularia subglabra TFB-10046 SS5]|nr:hypothetical protein AURDEDRAFT_116313 [Auricularia subglabra TFB-10046 SS5]